MIFREVEDRDLIAKARRGDVEAFNLLVSRWEKRVFNYLLRLLSNREDALDVSQDVFLKAYQNLPKLGDVDGIYSDLLLHNMGHELSDSGSYTVLEPEIASKDKSKQPRAANELEWRTPPLWGLRDSAPYLHDGRAATVADAVALHGGEGMAAARAYQRLSEKERQQVELFLKSLAAPKASP